MTNNDTNPIIKKIYSTLLLKKPPSNINIAAQNDLMLIRADDNIPLNFCLMSRVSESIRGRKNGTIKFLRQTIMVIYSIVKNFLLYENKK